MWNGSICRHLFPFGIFQMDGIIFRHCRFPFDILFETEVFFVIIVFLFTCFLWNGIIFRLHRFPLDIFLNGM